MIIFYTLFFIQICWLATNGFLFSWCYYTMRFDEKFHYMYLMLGVSDFTYQILLYKKNTQERWEKKNSAKFYNEWKF